MSTNRLYDTLKTEMDDLRPDEHAGRLKSFVWLLVGLFLSQRVHLSHIAKKIPGPATNKSKERRMRRLMANPALHVRSWYRPLAERLIRAIHAHGLPLHLLLDGSKVGFGHQLLMVGIAYRRRALPLAWTWVRGARGHSSGHKQLALLTYVQRLLPAEAAVSVAGDSEFGAIPVLEWLDNQHWKYVMRQPGGHLVQLPEHTTWQRLDTLIQRRRQYVWQVGAYLTRAHRYAVYLAAYWHPRETEPWLLATSYPDLRTALRVYRRRMWIEEMFGDFKRHGFDLESTQLRHITRLSRLTLAVALLYVWLVAYGSEVVKKGRRYLVDRKTRRDLSIFRIGLDMLERQMANDEPFHLRTLPYF